MNFINIKAVLGYVPDYVKDDNDETSILSWVLQGYTQNVRRRNVTDDYKVCIIKITNHKGALPQGMKSIQEAIWSYDKFVEFDENIWFPYEINGHQVMLGEAFLYSTFKHKGSGMRYVGNNPELLDNKCVNLFCNDCRVNFSTTKTLSQITTSEQEGYVALVYTSLAKDGDNFIIPDNQILLEALSYYVEGQHWRERRGRKEENANNLFLQNMDMSKNLFNQYLSSDALSKFNPDNYRNQILGTFTQLQNQDSYINRTTH